MYRGEIAHYMFLVLGLNAYHISYDVAIQSSI